MHHTQNIHLSYTRESHVKKFTIQRERVINVDTRVLCHAQKSHSLRKSETHHIRQTASVCTCGAVRFCYSVLQCVAVCCSVLQHSLRVGQCGCVAVCWNVLQCVAARITLVVVRLCCSVLLCVAVCCIVLQHAVWCCSVLQHS